MPTARLTSAIVSALRSPEKARITANPRASEVMKFASPACASISLAVVSALSVFLCGGCLRGAFVAREDPLMSSPIYRSIIAHKSDYRPLTDPAPERHECPSPRDAQLRGP